MKEEIDKGNIMFGLDETIIPGVRRGLFEKDEQVMRSVTFSYAQKASQDFAEIFNGIKVFDNPKSYVDLERIIEYLTEPGDVILDFFAGTGTTAHGVLLTNQRTLPQRQFICIQLPEPVNQKTEAGRNAFSIGCRTIADLCKERVRRVIQKLVRNQKEKQKTPELELGYTKNLRVIDLGFKVFKLAESNFKTWNANVKPDDTAALQEQLELHVDHIREGRTNDDILYEILIKSGYPLTTPVETLTLAGKIVYSAQTGAFQICLERELTLELIRAMAERKPERVVCLGEGFNGNDQLKANAVQIFKTKGVTSFKTV
jgi:adenine-specific DNA-methyltransferase